jgi:hypothetical protein
MGAEVFDWVTAAYVREMLLVTGDNATKQYIKNNMAPIIDVSHYAIFSINRETIRKHKIEVYQALLEHTITYENGAYTLELLWRQLFA